MSMWWAGSAAAMQIIPRLRGNHEQCSGGTKPMFVGTDYAGTAWYDKLGRVEEDVIIGDDGRGWFHVGDGSLSVYLKRV